MAEKMSEVYERYDIEIVATRRGRGATILTTTDGLYILEPFRGSISRLEQEHVLKELLEREGFSDLDILIPNVEGELLTYDRYKQPYVLKRHFAGEECDMRNLSDVVRSVGKLAEFHRAGKVVSSSFQKKWETVRKEKQKLQCREIKQALLDGEEIDHIARMYGMTPAGLREFVREQDVADEMVSEKKSESEQSYNMKEDLSVMGGDPADVILKNFARRNRELRKIHKFVSTVKRKNGFEILFLQIFEDYYKKGLRCEEVFAEVMKKNGICGEMRGRHYGICHGNYNQHNVILEENRVSIVHFEKFGRGNQLDDLYQFSRKVMEKNHFDYEILEEIMNTYAKQIELSQEDYRYMYVMFSYPEKFWKIANGYYNTNKAFVSPKYLEKLKMVIEQEKEKSELLTQYSSFHLI